MRFSPELSPGKSNSRRGYCSAALRVWHQNNCQFTNISYYTHVHFTNEAQIINGSDDEKRKKYNTCFIIASGAMYYYIIIHKSSKNKRVLIIFLQYIPF